MIWLYSLLGGLIQAAGTIVGRVLISLGIGYATYSGLDTSLTWLRDQIAGSFSGFASQSLSVLSALNVGSGLSVLLSALAVRLLLEGMSAGGAITRMVQK